MVDFTDAPIFSTMVMLQQCLCEEIESRNLPEVCFCSVVPGAQTIYDFSEGGQAWVRLQTAFPTRTFPQQDESLRNCAAGIAYGLEIGIVRCAPMLSEDGDPPSAAEQFEATRLQMADMMAMRAAIQCCMAKKDSLLSTYVPIGPEGGALGGSWTVWV